MKFFIARFLRSLSSLISIFVIKLYGDDGELGEYIYWLTLLFLLVILIKYNNQVFVLKFKDKIDEYYPSFFIIQLFFWAIINIGCLFFLPFCIYLAAVIFFSISLFEFWEIYYLVVKDFNITNKLLIKISLLSIIVKLLVVSFFQSNLSTIFLFLLALDFSPGLVIFILQFKENTIFKKTNFQKVKEIFYYLTPFLFNTILIYLTGKIDHFLISKYFDFESLGIYSFSYKLYEGAFIFQVIFTSILISKHTINLDKLDFYEVQFNRFIKKWFLYGTIIVSGICLFFNFIDSEESFPGYKEEIIVFIILMPGIIVSFFGVIMSNISSVHGFSKELLIVNLLNLLFSFGLNLILLKGFGVYAAAFISLLCQVLGSILLWLLFRRTRYVVINILSSLIFSKPILKSYK